MSAVVSGWHAVNQGAFCILVVSHFSAVLAEGLFNITTVVLERCECKLKQFVRDRWKAKYFFVAVSLVHVILFGSYHIAIRVLHLFPCKGSLGDIRESECYSQQTAKLYTQGNHSVQVETDHWVLNYF